MEKFIEKLDEYNIFNYLLPGVIFTYLIKYYVGIDIFQENIIEMLFIYYFVGSIISRIGSIIVEPILIKCKFIQYAPYEAYNKACEKDKKISQFLVANNMYRTICAGTMLLLLIKGFKELIEILGISISLINIFLIILVMLLYLFSYRKQTKIILERVDGK